MENIQNLYIDYLLSSFGQVTSTGLSSVLDGSVSHDRITRHLSGGAFGGKELWLSVKPFAKKHRSDDACVIFDDTIIEKPFSKVDGHNCYHYDHSKGRNVKGINLLNCLYHSESEKGDVRIPINYHLVAHFAMKAKVYLAAVKAAYKELNRIKGIEVYYEPA